MFCDTCGGFQFSFRLSEIKYKLDSVSEARKQGKGSTDEDSEVDRTDIQY